MDIRDEKVFQNMAENASWSEIERILLESDIYTEKEKKNFEGFPFFLKLKVSNLYGKAVPAPIMTVFASTPENNANPAAIAAAE